MKTNDDWFRDPDATLIRDASARAGAFALGAQSPDAALLVYLQPGAYTAQWTGGFLLRWSPNTELFEYVCQDNNRSPEGMVGGTQPVPRTSLIAP